jgi:hypothetical protein
MYMYNGQNEKKRDEKTIVIKYLHWKLTTGQHNLN